MHTPGTSPRNTIVLIAHAPLAQALRQCALHVFPDCGDDVLALDVPADEAPQETLRQAHALLDAADCGPSRATLILTDLWGATPANVALQLLRQRQSASAPAGLMAGVSLPMLLRACCYAHLPLPEMLKMARQGASSGVVVPDNALPPTGSSPSSTTTP